MARTPNKNTVSKARLSKASAIVKKKLTVKSEAIQIPKAAVKVSKTQKNMEQQIVSLHLSFQEFQKKNTLQIEQLSQKLSLYNKDNEPLAEGTPIVNALGEIKKIKMEVIDMNNNVFQVHKAMKDSVSIIETRINQLFIKLSLLIIFIALVLSFVIIWIQTNPS